MDKASSYCLFLVPLLLAVFIQGSVKKGVGVGPRSFLCDDFKALNNMFWWYDWGANLNTIKKYSNCSNIDQYVDNYVPMIWGRWNILNTTIPSQAAYILGFNEPNHFKQSNLTPEQAAKYWPLVEQISNGRLLVSPSAAPCGGQCHGDTVQWFDKFFKYCNGCRVDYLATHFYSCNAEKTMTFLRELYERYGKKIWLTEFSCPYTASPNKEHSYMKQILPQLEAAPFVYRYAWFASRIKQGTFVLPAASLLEPDSSTLTDLGRQYNSFSKPDISNSNTLTFMSLADSIKSLWKRLIVL